MITRDSAFRAKALNPKTIVVTTYIKVENHAGERCGDQLTNCQHPQSRMESKFFDLSKKHSQLVETFWRKLNFLLKTRVSYFALLTLKAMISFKMWHHLSQVDESSVFVKIKFKLDFFKT